MLAPLLSLHWASLMGYRASFLLFFAALALGGYAMFYDPSPQDGSEESARGLPLLSQEPAQVASLQLTRSEESLTLSRTSDDAWRITQPRKDTADGAAVEALLAQLAFTRTTRSLRDDPDFQLQTPRARLRLNFANGDTFSLDLGAPDASGRSAYARRSDTGAVVTIPAELAALLDRDPKRYRETRALVLNGDDLRTLSLDLDGKKLSMERAGPHWLLREPIAGRLDPARTEVILRALAALRATEFAPGESAPASPGTSPPTYTGSLRITQGTRSDTLRFGAKREATGEQGAQRLAYREGDETPFWLPELELEALLNQPTEPRDRRLFPFAAADVLEITLQQGDQRLALRQGARGWESIPSAELDAREIERWFDSLAALSVESFGSEPRDPEATTSPETVRVVVSLRGVKTQELLSIDAPSAQGLSTAARSGEKLSLSVPAGAYALFQPDALRFQNRLIASIDTGAALRLSVQAPGGSRYELTRENRRWRVYTPLEAPADLRIVEGFLDFFTELRAERLLPATTTRAQAQLDKPRAQVTLGLSAEAGGQSYTLSLGADANPGEVYAALEGKPGVFTLSARVLALFAVEFVELRPFIDLDARELRGFRLSGPGGELSLSLTASGWRRERPRAGALEDTVVLTYLGDILDLRAESLAVLSGETRRVYGFDKPEWQGALSRAGDAASWDLGSTPDAQGLRGLLRDGRGPVYLLTQEEANFLSQGAAKLRE
jgi:hypothetical protein